MKKNIQINLFGSLYNIDEDAYEILRKYLQNMRSFFSTKEGGEEISNDIESRINELLSDLKNHGTEAISINHVEDIIKRIGNPEEMEEEAENGIWESDQKEKKRPASPFLNSDTYIRKRWMRDPMNSFWGGIISGLCHYFGWQEVGVARMLFVLALLFFAFIVKTFSIIFFVLIAYFIGMLVLPKAITPEDRLMMYGKPINAKAVNDEFLNGVVYSPQYNKTMHNAPKDGLSTIGDFILTCLKIIGIFFGGLLLMTFLICIFGLSLIGNFNLFNFAFVHPLTGLDKLLFISALIFGFITIGIPLVTSVKTLKPDNGYPTAHPKKKHKWHLILLWFISLGLFLTLAITSGFRTKEIIRQNVVVPQALKDLNDAGWNYCRLVNVDKRNIIYSDYEDWISHEINVIELSNDNPSKPMFFTLAQYRSDLAPGKYRIQALVSMASGAAKLYVKYPDSTEKDIMLPCYTLSKLSSMKWSEVKKIPYLSCGNDSNSWERETEDEACKWSYVFLDFEVAKPGNICIGFTNQNLQCTPNQLTPTVKIANFNIKKLD